MPARRAIDTNHRCGALGLRRVAMHEKPGGPKVAEMARRSFEGHTDKAALGESAAHNCDGRSRNPMTAIECQVTSQLASVRIWPLSSGFLDAPEPARSCRARAGVSTGTLSRRWHAQPTEEPTPY